MDILFSKNSWEHYQYWQKVDKKRVKKINDLIKSIQRDWILEWEWRPELLRFSLNWYFSRRIDQENRLVYTIKWDSLIIASCRFHYK